MLMEISQIDYLLKYIFRIILNLFNFKTQNFKIGNKNVNPWGSRSAV